MKALINFKLTIKDTELVPQSWLHRTRVETQAFRFQASPLLKEQGHLFSAHSVLTDGALWPHAALSTGPGTPGREKCPLTLQSGCAL